MNTANQWTDLLINILLALAFSLPVTALIAIVNAGGLCGTL